MRDPVLLEAARRIERRRQRVKKFTDAIPAIVCILVMAVVLPVIVSRAYLQATVGPVSSAHLVVGKTIYHRVGWGNSAYYREALVTKVEGEQVVLQESGWLGTEETYHARKDLLDGHRKGLTLYREWAAK